MEMGRSSWHGPPLCYLNFIIAQSHGSDDSFLVGGGVRVVVVFGVGCGVHHRDFIVRLIFSFSRSIAKTRTFTDCPRWTISSGCHTKRSAICDLWTSQSLCKPTSTNAPKSVIFLTTPSSSSPILSSAISITLLAKTGGARSSLGSCHGFCSSCRMSASVSGQML